MLSHADLRERGWSDPLDESPVENPDGWHHGAVVHTGGGIYCRIWYSQEDPTNTADADDGDLRFDATYGSNFDGVTIERYEYDGDREMWRFAGTETLEQVPEGSDEACAETARELMMDNAPADLADAARRESE